MLVPGEKMSIFVLNKALLDAIEGAKNLKFYFKKARFSGQPMGVIAESEATCSDPEFKTLHELSTSTKM